MIKLIVKEKKNDLFNTVIKYVFFISLFIALFSVTELVREMHILEESSWFKEMMIMGDSESQIDYQKVMMVKNMVIVYGLSGSVALLVIMFIVTKMYIKKEEGNREIMKNTGYNKWQRVRCFTLSNLLDILFAGIVSMIAYNGVVTILRENTGIDELIKIAGLQVGKISMVVLIIFLVEVVFVIMKEIWEER